MDDTISDTLPPWQRCRLLVRRIMDAQGGGRGGGERYQLELYDPPKVEIFAHTYLYTYFILTKQLLNICTHSGCNCDH